MQRLGIEPESTIGALVSECEYRRYKPPTTTKQPHTKSLNQAIFINESAAMTWPTDCFKHALALGQSIPSPIGHLINLLRATIGLPASFFLVQYPSSIRGLLWGLATPWRRRACSNSTRCCACRWGAACGFKVRQYFANDRRIFDAGYYLHRTATRTAYTHVYIEHTLEPHCGAAFRTAQPFTPARSQIRLVRPISLHISDGRLYLANTVRRHALSVPTVRGQYSMKSSVAAP